MRRSRRGPCRYADRRCRRGSAGPVLPGIRSCGRGAARETPIMPVRPLRRALTAPRPHGTVRWHRPHTSGDRVMSYRTPALLALALLAGAPAFAAEMTPVGTWTTIDDATGKPKSIVQITESGGKLEGK